MSVGTVPPAGRPPCPTVAVGRQAGTEALPSSSQRWLQQTSPVFRRRPWASWLRLVLQLRNGGQGVQSEGEGVTALAWSPRLGSRLPAVGGHVMKFLLKLSFYRIKQERVHDAELRCVLFLLSESPRKARQGHFCGSDILKRLLPATERGERSEEADRAPTSAHVG